MEHHPARVAVQQLPIQHERTLPAVAAALRLEQPSADRNPVELEVSLGHRSGVPGQHGHGDLVQHGQHSGYGHQLEQYLE